jgi:hypothetical protein
MTDDWTPSGDAGIDTGNGPHTMILVGWNNRDGLTIDGPAVFVHESAKANAAARFHLPDGMEQYTLPIGFRAVVAYDEENARNVIVKVMPIPTV